MRSFNKFAARFAGNRSGKLALGVVALVLVVGSVVACAAEKDSGDSAGSDISTFGSTGYDTLPYRHGSLLLPR